MFVTNKGPYKTIWDPEEDSNAVDAMKRMAKKCGVNTSKYTTPYSYQWKEGYHAPIDVEAVFDVALPIDDIQMRTLVSVVQALSVDGWKSPFDVDGTPLSRLGAEALLHKLLRDWHLINREDPAVVRLLFHHEDFSRLEFKWSATESAPGFVVEFCADASTQRTLIQITIG